MGEDPTGLRQRISDDAEEKPVDRNVKHAGQKSNYPQLKMHSEPLQAVWRTSEQRVLQGGLHSWRGNDQRRLREQNT